MAHHGMESLKDGGDELYELEERGLLVEGRKAGEKLPGGDDGFDDYESEYEEGEEVDNRRGRRRRRRRTGRGGSASTAASFQLYTPDEEKAVVRKFDRRLVVFVALLYMLSFLDRSSKSSFFLGSLTGVLMLTAVWIDIGNARVAGMDEDLRGEDGEGSDWYEWALTAFYITYIGFEWMALLWKVVPPHIYISVLVLSWGLTASLQAVAVNYPMLIALRALLGIGEAGFTGVPFYLSFFFKRHELAFRTAIFISGMSTYPSSSRYPPSTNTDSCKAAPLATTFASTLAWLIMKLGQKGPIAPWRLLFLVEGFPSVLFAALAWSIIPDSPQTASYLTPREKKVASLRLRRENPSSGRASKELRTTKNSLRAREIVAVLADPVAWLTASIFFLTNMAYSSLPVFLPTILTAMGHSALSAQALAAPPYLAAFLIVLATAHASDADRSRSPWLIASALLSAAGYGTLALTGSPWIRLPPGNWLRYLAVYPATVGFFNVVVLTVSWSLNNQRGTSRQGGGFALLQVVGQCGPLVGTRLYPDGDAPYYEKGMTVCAAAMLGVAVIAVGLRLYLGRLNRKLDEMEEEEGGLRDDDDTTEAGRGEEEEGEEGGEGEALVPGGIGTSRREGREGRGRWEGGGGGFRYML